MRGYIPLYKGRCVRFLERGEYERDKYFFHHELILFSNKKSSGP